MMEEHHERDDKYTNNANQVLLDQFHQYKYKFMRIRMIGKKKSQSEWFI